MLKKPSKITLCRYRQPSVTEMADWAANCRNEAITTCALHNDKIVANAGSLENEFWFLNTQIKGATHIITASSLREYPSNDPEIMAKLAAYLDGNSPGPEELLMSKKPHKLNKQSEVLRSSNSKDLSEINRLAQALTAIIGDTCEVSVITFNGKYCIKVSSWYLTKEQIKAAIDQVVTRPGK